MKTLFNPLAIFLTLLTFSLALSSCAAGSSLKGTSWVLLELNGRADSLMENATLNFEADGVNGKAACNNFFGSYHTKGSNGLSFSALGQTEMYCMEPEGLMDLEGEYLHTLGMASRYEINNGELDLYDASGVLLMRLLPGG